MLMLVIIIMIEIRGSLELYKYILNRYTLYYGVGLFGKTLKELVINERHTEYF